MAQHADRNAQFENIAKLKQQYLDAGQPVISMDTKKKEMLGNFYLEGVTDGVEPTIVSDHDFTMIIWASSSPIRSYNLPGDIRKRSPRSYVIRT